ncbi:MAG: class II aldolase/adducin family protein [Acidimicrobiia bacterium]|nr:class II aldolase/adducin family protein [Acidimicrobiia bacterium]
MKEEVLKTAKDMLRKGLVEGTAGNISARMPDGSICITPSSVDYEAMALEDLCIIDLDGEQIEGERGASSEKLLHTAIYKAFDDVQSVIHSHPVYATMFAIARKPIPPCIDEFSIYVGGEVPVTEYGQSGTQDVGDNAVKVLTNRGAALLANHGMLACGPSPAKVLHITALVERSAKIVWGAMALGDIHQLPGKVNQDFANIYTGWMRTAP